jgi:hypothetical protein
MQAKTKTTIVLAGMGLLLPAVPAVANAGEVGAAGGADPVVATGTCSAGSGWTLGAMAIHRKIGVRFHLDTAAPAQKWRLVGAHNLVRVITGAKFTDALGDIQVTRKTWNLPGQDTYRVFARNKATAETCVAVLNF